MNILKNKTFILIKEYFLIALGVFLYVLGWSIFLVPHNLVGGGVTGIASIVQYASGGVIKIGYTFFVLNIGLLVLAMCTLGKGFGTKTVFAIILDSIGLILMQDLIPQEYIQLLALDNGKFVSTIMGGIIVGVGVGLTIISGGSTGGTDIIAMVLNKYRNVSPGRVIMLADALVILSSLLVPSYRTDGTLLAMPEKITVVVYGFIMVMVVGTVLDLCIAGSKQSVQLFIFSPKYAQIADAITNDFHKGVTVLNGKGWYTKNETNVLFVLIRKRDLTALLKYVKMVDENAFMSISQVTGVYGKGFEDFKLNKKKK